MRERGRTIAGHGMECGDVGQRSKASMKSILCVCAVSSGLVLSEQREQLCLA